MEASTPTRKEAGHTRRFSTFQGTLACSSNALEKREKGNGGGTG